MTQFLTGDAIIAGLQSNPHDVIPAAELERLRPQADDVAARFNAKVVADPRLRRLLALDRCEISVSPDTLSHGKPTRKVDVMAQTPEEFKTEVENVVSTLEKLATDAETVEGLPPAINGVLKAATTVLSVGEKLLNDIP